ncbi:MAG: asparagine synthase (glutamine-hydrolyzing) [Dehalococcoidia bacterium]|nr:asparagine synthase (glutamine-hydrolyzing) [Dehalococcoidia bacterium]
MCGIAGGANLTQERPVDGPLLSAMLGTLRHRGPDDEGQFIDAHVALGTRRLSIIDVQGGHQPIGNEDGSVWVALNGEIFNFPSLRAQLADRGHRFATQSDTEVIVHGYEEWGDAVVERLNGQFAFALWDKGKERLLLARDRVGIKPLYYSEHQGGVVFGSELKALLCCPWIPRSLDLDALDQYLTYEHIPVPRTIFRAIKKLAPGHTLILDRRGVELRQYWDFDLAQSESGPVLSAAAWEERFRSALWEAVEMELISDVPLGVFLSGGIDSSAIAALMSQHKGPRVQSFSIAFDDPSFDESQHARLVAEHLGTEHHEQTLSEAMMWDLVPRIADFLDEPMGDSSFIPCYLLARFARERVTVALGGDGGDELLAGYSTMQAHRLAGLYNRAPAGLRDGLIGPLVRRLPVSHDNLSLDFRAKRFVASAALPPVERHHLWLGSFSPQEKVALLRPEVRSEVDGDTFAVARGHFEHCGADDPLNRILYTDLKLYMDTDILTKVDRSSMANSLEARVPFLNQVVLEVAAQMPLDMKLRGFTRKHVLRRIMKGVLPDRILSRPKKGFNIPVAKWFRNELKPLLQDSLSESKIVGQGLFEPAAVSTMLEEHFSGRRDNRKHLWTLLVFQLWHDRWLAPSARPAKAALT